MTLACPLNSTAGIQPSVWGNRWHTRARSTLVPPGAAVIGDSDRLDGGGLGSVASAVGIIAVHALAMTGSARVCLSRLGIGCVTDDA